jgi:hypothetical protein
MTVDYDKSANEWNKVLLGSIWLPGVCVLSIDKCGRDIDQQKQKGSNKAYSEDSGRNLATGTILVQLPGIKGPQYDAWVQAIATLDPASPTASTGPIEIVHPNTRLRGIKAIRIIEITSPSPTAREGYCPAIKWIEYSEKPKEVKKAATKPSKPFTGDTSMIAGGPPMIQLLEPQNAPGLSGMDAFDKAMSNYK